MRAHPWDGKGKVGSVPACNGISYDAPRSRRPPLSLGTRPHRAARGAQDRRRNQHRAGQRSRRLALRPGRGPGRTAPRPYPVPRGRGGPRCKAGANPQPDAAIPGPPAGHPLLRGLRTPVAEDRLLCTSQKRVGCDTATDSDSSDRHADPVAPGGTALGQGTTEGRVFRDASTIASDDSFHSHVGSEPEAEKEMRSYS
jgi:hypothetical protein